MKTSSIPSFSLKYFMAIILTVSPCVFSLQSQSQKFEPVSYSMYLGDDRFLISLVQGTHTLYGLVRYGGKKPKKNLDVVKFENNTWNVIAPEFSPVNPSMACSGDTLYVADIEPGRNITIEKFIHNTRMKAGIPDGASYYSLYPDKIKLINDADDLYLLVSGLGGALVYMHIAGNWVKLGSATPKIFPDRFFCSAGIPAMTYRYYDAEFKPLYATAMFNGKHWVKVSNQGGDGLEYATLHNGNIYAISKYSIKPVVNYDTELILTKYVNKTWSRVKTDSLMLPSTFYAIRSDNKKMQFSYFDKPFTGALKTKDIYFESGTEVSNASNKDEEITDTLVNQVTDRIKKYLKVYSFDKKSSSILYKPKTRMVTFVDVASNKYYQFNIDKVKLSIVNTLDDNEKGYNLMIACADPELCIDTYNLTTHEKTDGKTAFYIDFYIKEIADKVLSDFMLLKQ